MYARDYDNVVRQDQFLSIGESYIFFDVESREDKIGMVISFDKFKTILWVDGSPYVVKRRFVKRPYYEKNGNR